MASASPITADHTPGAFSCQSSAGMASMETGTSASAAPTLALKRTNNMLRNRTETPFMEIIILSQRNSQRCGSTPLMLSKRSLSGKIWTTRPKAEASNENRHRQYSMSCRAYVASVQLRYGNLQSRIISLVGEAALPRYRFALIGLAPFSRSFHVAPHSTQSVL